MLKELFINFGIGFLVIIMIGTFWKIGALPLVLGTVAAIAICTCLGILLRMIYRFYEAKVQGTKFQGCLWAISQENCF